LTQEWLAAALPPDVRRGFASPCDVKAVGLCPWFELCSSNFGPKAVRGAEPVSLTRSPARQSLAAHQTAACKKVLSGETQVEINDPLTHVSGFGAKALLNRG